MTPDDLNGRFQNLYDQQKPEVPNRIWEKIDAELFPKKKRKGMVFWLSIFAGSVILTGTWLMLNNGSKSTSSVVVSKYEKKAKNNKIEQAHAKIKISSKSKSKTLTSKNDSNEINTSSTDKHKSHLTINSIIKKNETIENSPFQNDPTIENSLANHSEDKNLAVIELVCFPNLPILPIAHLNSPRSNLMNLSSLSPNIKSKENESKFSISSGVAIGKNVRFTNKPIDPELSVSKHGGDNRMALNLIQIKSGISYTINEKYAIGIGVNYGHAQKSSPWYIRSTYYTQGQQSIPFQTLVGRYTVNDVELLNSLNPNDTNNIRLKNYISIRMLSIPLTVYYEINKSDWKMKINAGLSTDIHFGKEFQFDIEQNNSTRQLLGSLDNYSPEVSLQGLIGARFSHHLFNSFNLYIEPQLSLPLTSYSTSNSQNSYSSMLTIGAGIFYKL